jgi:putative ABC transport system permease protein
MTFWHIAISRLRSFFRRRQDDDLRDELASYLGVLTDRYRRAGLSAPAARRAALVEAGGLAPITEAVRAIRVGVTLETALRDIRYGVRIVRRSPGYAAVVTVTMALGIGIAASTFGVLHAVLWRPLPYPDADRLVAIEVDARGVTNAGAASGEMHDLRSTLQTLTQVGAAIGVDASLSVDGQMDRVAAASVTDDVLPVLGATPMALGRPLHDAEDEGQDAVRAIVISHELWTRWFHRDPTVLGRHVRINNLDVTIVGVTRPGFRAYLPPATHVEESVDVWFPTSVGTTRAWGYRYGPLVARLAPRATLGQAQAELDQAAGRFVHADPADYPDGQLRLRVRPLTAVLTDASRPALLALGAAVGFVLLIACVNVANVMLSRTKARDRELAVRGALGATRSRLIGQLLAENVVLASLGGFGGWLLAIEATALIGWLRPPHLPRLEHIAIDPQMLWVALVATTLAIFLFSLLPAWIATRPLAPTALQGTRGAAGLRTRRWQRGLVTAEIALSIVPLVAAGLMARTFLNLTHAPLGFDPSHVLTAHVAIDARRLADTGPREAFYRAAVERVRQLPGVEAVSAGAPLPLTPNAVPRRCSSPDAPGLAPVGASQVSVLPGFLSVMGIRIVAGRDLTPEDLATHRAVALVDEELAHTLWADHPLGRRLVVQSSRTTTTAEVVGVTVPIRTARVREASGPTVFVPYAVYQIELALVVRTTASVAAMGPAIKASVEALGGGRPVFDVRPLDGLVADSIAEERFTLLVVAGFAAAALFLAAVGLFGTLSYFISQRMPEFGVRAALGASAAALVGNVLGEGARLTALGTGAGLLSSLAVVGVFRQLLYGVAPVDAFTMGAVAGSVALVALLAVARPAWRAAHVDPTRALRGD